MSIPNELQTTACILYFALIASRSHRAMPLSTCPIRDWLDHNCAKLHHAFTLKLSQCLLLLQFLRQIGRQAGSFTCFLIASSNSSNSTFNDVRRSCAQRSSLSISISNQLALRASNSSSKAFCLWAMDFVNWSSTSCGTRRLLPCIADRSNSRLHWVFLQKASHPP